MLRVTRRIDFTFGFGLLVYVQLVVLTFWLRAVHRQTARRIEFTFDFELLRATRRID